MKDKRFENGIIAHGWAFNLTLSYMAVNTYVTHLITDNVETLRHDDCKMFSHPVTAFLQTLICIQKRGRDGGGAYHANVSVESST